MGFARRIQKPPVVGRFQDAAGASMDIKAASFLIIALTFSSALTALGYQSKPVRAWSEPGHTIVASQAGRLLPQPWSSFFGYYGLIVNKTSTYPDSLYKELDPNEGPRHFIDLEVWSPSKPDTGTLPFAIDQYAAEMAQAIKNDDWNLMFIDAGRLAHYVADINQPYHSTVNYNPRNKAGKGLHAVLDDSMEAHIEELKLVEPSDVATLQPVQNLTAFMFYIAWQSHSFLDEINHTLIDEGKSWSPELTRMIENRTNAAIISLARVWYTVILNTGRQAPTIPSPNKLSIKIESSLQSVDIQESLSVTFTVLDSLGVRAILKPKANADGIPVNVYADQALKVPFGRYAAVIPPDTLKQFSRSSLTLNLLAQSPGYQSAATQLQIQVARTQPQTQTTTTRPSAQPVITPAVLLLALIIVLGAGLTLARQAKRTRKGFSHRQFRSSLRSNAQCHP